MRVIIAGVIVGLIAVFIRVNYFSSPNYIDPELMSTYEQFRVEAKEQGINCWKIDMLDNIMFEDISSFDEKRFKNTLGLHTGTNIYIDIDLKDPRLYMTKECVIYHELAHALGVKHDTVSSIQQIMKPNLFSEHVDQYYYYKYHRTRMKKYFWEYVKNSLQ